MVKYLIATLFFATVTVPACAQSAQPQGSQFCSLVVSDPFGPRQHLTLDYGQRSKVSPITDSELQQEVSAIEAMDSVVQGLAYLTQHGWQVIGFSTPGVYEHFYLRRVKL